MQSWLPTFYTYAIAQFQSLIGSNENCNVTVCGVVCSLSLSFQSLIGSNENCNAHAPVADAGTIYKFQSLIGSNENCNFDGYGFRIVYEVSIPNRE